MYNPSAAFGGGVSKRSLIMFQQSSINALKFCHSTVSYRLCELYLHARSKDMLKNLHPGKNIINFYDTEAWVQWNHYKSPIILNQKTAPCLHQMTPSGLCVETNPWVIHTRPKSRKSEVSFLSFSVLDFVFPFFTCRGSKGPKIHFQANTSHLLLESISTLWVKYSFNGLRL